MKRQENIISFQQKKAMRMHNTTLAFSTNLEMAVEQDYNMARHYFTLAVEQGDTGAQVALESFEFDQHGCSRK